MTKITVNRLRRGMVLSSDVVDRSGLKLLPSGTVITDHYLQSLREWGIYQIEVVDRQDRGQGQGDDMISREIKVAKKFSPLPMENPLVSYLYEKALKRPVNPDKGEIFISRPVGTRGKGIPSYLSVMQLLESHPDLVSLPDVYYRIVECLKSPISSSSDLAAVVGMDTNLTARLLRLVNSPVYSPSSPVNTVARAITLLGAKQLSTLALGVSVISIFDDLSPEYLTMEEFWRHSLATAIIAKLIAKDLKLDQELLFTAGTLHDLGRLIMVERMPFQMEAAIYLSYSKQTPLYEAERETLGFDHGRVGGKLLKMWGIPDPLQSIVRFHHTPAMAKGMELEADVIALSDMITIALDIGSSGSKVMPPMKFSGKIAPWLSPEHLDRWIEQGENQIEGAMEFFSFGSNRPSQTHKPLV
nr:HDOD domain-containing protein [uncultured Dethiosulfovibrio sp.]